MHRDCGGEKKRHIPFRYLNHVPFEAAGGWTYPFLENSDSQHHLVFGEMVSVTDPVAKSWSVRNCPTAFTHQLAMLLAVLATCLVVADARYFVEFRKGMKHYKLLQIVVPTWTQESSILHGNIRQDQYPGC